MASILPRYSNCCASAQRGVLLSRGQPKIHTFRWGSSRRMGSTVAVSSRSYAFGNCTSRVPVFHRWSWACRNTSTLQALDELVRAGKLEPDRAQKRVAKRLTRLQEVLGSYDNSMLFERPSEESVKGKGETSQPDPNNDETTSTSATNSNANERDNENRDSDSDIDARKPPPAPRIQIPRGLYIYGKVGTGKTMLMDSFYENASLVGNRKRRLHFHDFLSQIHAEIHKLKQRDLEEKGRNFSVDTSLANNPIHRVGLEFASKVSLLCLDEFQVTDIADALILSQLFGVLFAKGTVVVATSNRPPQDLYEGGLNRSYFLPFIDLLERHCITHHIPSQKDYRRLLSNCSSFFWHPDKAETDDHPTLDHLISGLARELVATGDDDDDDDDSAVLGADLDFDATTTIATVTPRSMELPVGFRRSISVNRVYGGDTSTKGMKDNDKKQNNSPSMACFSFEELCDTEKGSMDYRAIARAFDIVVLVDIPTMDLEGHNRARRFITLIDELYEGKCALVCSTLVASTPGELFEVANRQQDVVDAAEDEKSQDPPPEMALGIDVAQEGGTSVGALASVRELSFAFERSSSRIFEMCSRSWWDRVLGF